MTRDEIIQKAAIEVLPECMRTCKEILMRGGSLGCNSIPLQTARMAVEYAKALADELTECQ